MTAATPPHPIWAELGALLRRQARGQPPPPPRPDPPPPRPPMGNARRRALYLRPMACQAAGRAGPTPAQRRRLAKHDRRGHG